MLCLLMIHDGTERMMVLHYQITLKEHLEDSWSTWFDGLAITHAADGTTTLAGVVRDQSALYGLIDKARDLGLTLVAVGQSAPPALADEPRV
jgi:ABC-type arginine/histidine transport system permease subunit